jgi:serine/threonine-protein kinase
LTPQRWQQIEELLQAALERKAEERNHFLASVCGEDNTLRSEVESLIKAHEKAGDFIESPALEVAAKAMAAAQMQSLSGEMISHFKIISTLGAGGMGEVYLAQDLKLGRRVALKLLPAIATVSIESRKRFLREAQLASVLDHPNICTVHEIGNDAGCHFIAMQYIEGETLKKAIGGQPLELSTLLSISLQIADALSEAHSRGIIHRDIKPSNIMITPRRQAKVLDFGLAKSLEIPDVTHSNLQDMESTVTRADIGTPAYMSPEQARGREVDYRSDIFSFGTVIYEMATGRVPFMRESSAETMNAVINKPHQPACELNNALPIELSALIDRLLSSLPMIAINQCRQSSVICGKSLARSVL